MIIEYNPILYTAGYGAAISSIIKKAEIQTNIALTDLSRIQDIAFSVQHPITGQEMEWRDLISEPLTSVNWTLSTSNELGRMTQMLEETKMALNELKVLI